MALVSDNTWVSASFLVAQADLTAIDQSNRFFSEAMNKFTDTKPGGSQAINPPPQFTRNADIRVTGKLHGSDGMGRYYSDAIDDNAQTIYMRFGVPAFNSMTTFFSSFYSPQAGQLARTGRASNVFYNFGKAAGLIVQVLNWQLLAVHLLGVAAKYLAQVPSSKFYYMKPTMPLYWNAVQTMVNQIAVNRGIVPRIGSTDAATGNLNDIGGGYDTWSDADRQKLGSIFPSVFDATSGQIDVYAIATRAQRLERTRMKTWTSVANGDVTDLGAMVTSVTNEHYSPSANTSGYQTYLSNWLATTTSTPSATSDATTTGSAAASTSNEIDDTTESIADSVDNNPSFWSFLEAEIEDGSAFAGFRVNYTGAMSESFANSFGESDVASKINSASASARNMKFDLAGGNLGDGILAKTAEGIMGAAKDVASGLLDSVGASGLAALGGSAFVDIPQNWQQATANLTSMSYTINLRSPYGNPMSQMINLYIPLAMLLAGALPLSTGMHSYTSPFLCELYDKGRCQTRLGMIDSISITRGVGNLGFNRDGNAMGIDVTFTVKELSTILHMPIAQGMSVVGAGALAAVSTLGSTALDSLVAAGTNGFFDDDSLFSDYMAVLGAMGINDQIYGWRKFKLNLTRSITNAKSFVGKDHMASFLGNTVPGRIMNIFYKGIQH